MGAYLRNMICLYFKTVGDWVRRVESIGGSKLSGWDRIRLGQNPVPTPYGSGCAWISRAETRHFFDELVFSDGADRAQRQSWSRSTIDSRAASRTLAGRRHAASCPCTALTSPTRSLHARAHEKNMRIRAYWQKKFNRRPYINGKKLTAVWSATRL